MITNTDDSFGQEHSVFYLESALKKVKHRQSSEAKDDNVNKEIVIDEENNQIDLMAENDICDDIRIKNALKELPSKNVIFSDDDQSNVLILYNVVRKVAVERDYEEHDSVAADLTEEIFKTKNYYSTISSRTIHRWYLLCNKEIKKSGKKINSEFEKEVWGNLMLCVFEKNENKEVCMKYFFLLVTSSKML